MTMWTRFGCVCLPRPISSRRTFARNQAAALAFLLSYAKRQRATTAPGLVTGGWRPDSMALSKMLTLEKLSIECGINIYAPRLDCVPQPPSATIRQLVNRKRSSQQLPSVGLRFWFWFWIAIMSRALFPLKWARNRNIHSRSFNFAGC